MRNLFMAACLTLASASYAQLQESLPGLIVIEPETVQADNWLVESEFEDASGNQYVRYNGQNNFSRPDQNVGLFFQFVVQEGGDYLLDVRSLKNGDAGDAENDSWFAVNGGTFVKTFTGGFVGQWTWDTRFEFPGGVFQDQPIVTLVEGLNILEIRGRSTNHRIDRIVLSDDRFEGNPEDLSLPISVEEIPTMPIEDFDFSNPDDRALFNPVINEAFDPPVFVKDDVGLILATPDSLTTGTVIFGSFEKKLDLDYEEFDDLEVRYRISGRNCEVRIRLNDVESGQGLTQSHVDPSLDNYYVMSYSSSTSGNSIVVSFDIVFTAKSENDVAEAILYDLAIEKLADDD